MARIAGVDLPRNKRIEISLTYIFGVGRKTANVVLGNAFEIQVGIVVDTHVKRLSERLRFSKANSAEKVEQDLQKLVPSHHWTIETKLSYLLFFTIHHISDMSC